MESVNIDTANNNVYGTSWLAYIRPIVTFLIIFLIGLGLSGSRTTIFAIIGYVAIGVALINFICNILFLKTLRVWFNEDGVWLFCGIFPWTKGTVGTTWRDISDAIFFTGFISWATKSFKIRIGHRFTKTSELVIPHIKNGNVAVMKINEIVKTKYREEK